jgi:type IV pilus assembly protein PilC
MSEPLPQHPRPSQFGIAVQVGTILIFWILLWAQLLVVAPRCKRLFDDFGLQLPSLTRTVLGFSSWSLANWWLVIPSALAAIVGLLGLLAFFRNRPGWGRLTWLLAVLLIGGFFAVNGIVAGSLIVPWIRLQEGLAR